MRYRYKALNAKGRVVRGIVSAANEGDLFNQLQAGGLELLHCKTMSERSALTRVSFLSKKIQTRDLVQLFTHMWQMQRAGVHMLDSIADLRDSAENPEIRDVMTDIYREVSEGKSLSEAMKLQPKVFKPLYVAVVAAGEESNKLLTCFEQLIEYLKWMESIGAKIRKATTYPIILGIFIILAVVIMMTVAVPQIVGFLRESDQILPGYTLALLAVSDFFVEKWWLVLFALPVVKIVISILNYLSTGFSRRLDWLMLRLPLVGTTIRKINIARFAQTFAALFNSGVEVIRALEAAAETVTNKALQESVAGVIEHVRAGSTLSEAFYASGEFPMLVVRMIKVGEDTGELSDVLGQITDVYARDVDEEIQKLIAMIEPLLTVILGGMMLWIVLGTFGPIYGSFGSDAF